MRSGLKQKIPSDGVGPVLQAGAVADVLIEAIRRVNQEVEIIDRGSYVRVKARSPCRLLRQDVEQSLGRSFVFPKDLELVMTSFSGRLVLSETEAIWE